MGYKRAEGVKAQLRHARVKLKHLVEAAGALRGLSVNRAQAYLADVLARRRAELGAAARPSSSAQSR
ncbi:hypothetical protein D910_03324 [Dendroctonus ponderosae]|uniref:Uncharacterized protein n=1 Tax=Dendroctonus ponderosae TaxID=77166 RepID=U4TWH1_DENPD|nr:hypothetical protein D910_03324 [Dendroctonus ponderosae]